MTAKGNSPRHSGLQFTNRVTFDPHLDPSLPANLIKEETDAQRGEGLALNKHFSQCTYRAGKAAKCGASGGLQTLPQAAARTLPLPAGGSCQGEWRAPAHPGARKRPGHVIRRLLSRDLSTGGGGLRPRWRPTCSGGASFSSTRIW